MENLDKEINDKIDEASLQAIHRLKELATWRCERSFLPLLQRVQSTLREAAIATGYDLSGVPQPSGCPQSRLMWQLCAICGLPKWSI